jgi:hypothetical protein
LNSDEVEGCLASHGFEIIDIDSYSIPEALDLLSQAQIIAAPVGAALGNFVLATGEAEFIHLVPDYLVAPSGMLDAFIFFKRPYFPLLDRLQFLLGKTSQQGSELPPLDRPLTYDKRSLEIAILQAEKRIVMKRLRRQAKPN